jgi:hypothetical protein
MFGKAVMSAFMLVTLVDLPDADLSRPTPAEACAAFILHLLTLLEDHGRAAVKRNLATVLSDSVNALAASAGGHYDPSLDRHSRIDLHSARTISKNISEMR